MNSRSVLFLLVLLCSGCSMKMGKFSILSTKPLDLNNVKVEQIKEDAIGVKECKMIVLFPTCWYPKIDQAVQNVLEKTGGDFIVNAEAKFSWWFIPFIYEEKKMRVTGDVYKIVHDPDNSGQ